MTANIRILTSPQETSFPLPSSAKIGDVLKIHFNWDTTLGGYATVDLLPPTGVDIRSWIDTAVATSGTYSYVVNLLIAPTNALGVCHLLPSVTEMDGLKMSGMRVDITILPAVITPPPTTGISWWVWGLGLAAVAFVFKGRRGKKK